MHPSDRARESAVLIDVRSLMEYASGHLQGAVHLPLDQLQHRIRELVPDKSKALLLYCASGARSSFGCTVLQQMGYEQAVNGGGLGQAAMVTGRPITR